MKKVCGACGSSKKKLYQNSCRHITLCFDCGKSMAVNKAKCPQCETPVTRLIIWEINVRRPTEEEQKEFDENKFVAGFPEGTEPPEHGTVRVMKDETGEGNVNCPLELQNEAGDIRFQVQPQKLDASWFMLMAKNGELVAFPVNSWFKMTKAPVPTGESSKSANDEEGPKSDDEIIGRLKKI